MSNLQASTIMGLFFGGALAAVSLGCSASDSQSPIRSSSGGSGNSTGATAGAGNSTAMNVGGASAVAGASNVGGATGVAGSPSTGGTPSAGGAPNNSPMVALPFTVEPGDMTPGFGPSGIMPDGMGVTSSPADASTPDPLCMPPAGAKGVCRIFSVSAFNPADNWLGVYYQFGNQNWGTSPGLRIAAGATKIHFQAKGDKGGEKIMAGAGGIGWDKGSLLGTTTYSDGFYMPLVEVTLTADWSSFDIPLPAGASYSGGVLGGFVWTVNSMEEPAPIKFYITDIQWQ